MHCKSFLVFKYFVLEIQNYVILTFPLWPFSAIYKVTLICVDLTILIDRYLFIWTFEKILEKYVFTYCMCHNLIFQFNISVIAVYLEIFDGHQNSK